MADLLAFDTSTESMSIALQLPQGSFLHEAPGGAQASSRLIADIQALLSRAGTELAQLDAIAFGCGPGAFTGLRTACSVAQGLAFGAGKPVLPVDSLLLVAQDAFDQMARPDACTVWVAMDARMDEIYAAAYRWRDGRWHTLQAPALHAVGALQERWQAEPPEAVAGNALQTFAGRLTAPGALRFDATRSRAQALLDVAQQMWRDGGAADPAQALPVYLRDKVAQTTAEREALRRHKEAAP